MRVQVQLLDGNLSQFECSSVAELKALVAEQTNTTESLINLIAAGEELTKIEEGIMAYVTFEMDGGKKKKGKKKAFTTKKKNKHKHRKEKLATLKLYSLDKNGAV